MDGWKKWDGCHNEPDQIKRITSAKKAECTPIELDRDEWRGRFSGSHGQYSTTLDACECVDFIRRKKPCKHMYRLAMELGKMQGVVDTDASKIKKKPPAGFNLSTAVDVLESLNVSAQLLTMDLLAEMLYRDKRAHVGVRVSDELNDVIKSGIFVVCDDLTERLMAYKRDELVDMLTKSGVSGFRKNMRRGLLASWVAENVEDASSMFCDSIAVSLSDSFARPARKMYTYLRRVHDPSAWDDVAQAISVTTDADGVCFELTYEQSDEMASQLIKHGHFPPSGQETDV